MTDKTEQTQTSDTIVRIATILALPAVLEELAYNPAEVLAKSGVELSLFDNPDNILSYARRSQLIRHCVNITGCTHLGHLIGRHTDASSFGLVGLLMQQSTDVAAALRSLARLTHLHVSGAVIYLEEEDDLAFLGYSIIQPGTVARTQIEDGAVTIAFNILRQLCGPAWQPLQALFAHSEPTDTSPFRQFFKTTLQFDAERNGIFFHASWLQQPVVGADPKQRRLLQEQIDQLESQYIDDLAEQVRRVLPPALLTQHASADQVAALFSITQRTMHRRLHVCGTSFQQLTDESSFEISQQLLENSLMQLSQIAETLDYADGSSFTRAFRRWSGMTPSVWRERYQQTNT